MVSGEALKKLQEQIAAWPMTQRFVVQQLIEDYSRNREDLHAYTGRHAEWSGYRRMGGRPWGYIIEIPDHARRQLNMHCFRKWRSALWIRWNDEEVWAFWFKQQQVRHLCGERRLTPKGVTA